MDTPNPVLVSGSGKVAIDTPSLVSASGCHETAIDTQTSSSSAAVVRLRSTPKPRHCGPQW
jgi:hypothetical protein